MLEPVRAGERQRRGDHVLPELATPPEKISVWVTIVMVGAATARIQPCMTPWKCDANFRVEIAVIGSR